MATTANLTSLFTMIGRTDEIRESQSYKEKYERKGKEFPNPFFLSFSLQIKREEIMMKVKQVQ